MNGADLQSLIKIVGFVLAVIVCSSGKEITGTKILKVKYISGMLIIGNLVFFAGMILEILYARLTGDAHTAIMIGYAGAVGLALSSPAGMYSWFVLFGRNKNERFSFGGALLPLAYLFGWLVCFIGLAFKSNLALYIVAILIYTILHGVLYLRLKKESK